MLLENKNVKLRLMQKEHIDEIFRVAVFPEIWAYMSIEIKNKEDVVKYVESSLSQGETGTEIPFVIIDAITNRIIGSTKLMDIHKSHQRGEIGFTWLTPHYWRSEINTNCKYLLLKYCFEVLKWQRVQIKTDLENLRSQKAIERIGAKKEGILRNHMIRKDGTTRHTVMYSITKEEWSETKQYIEQLLAR